jgi:hypothetical protein
LKAYSAGGGTATKSFDLKIACNSASQTITRVNDNVLEFTVNKIANPGPNDGSNIQTMITAEDLEA